MLEQAKANLRKPLLPLVRALASAGLHPDQLTVAGVVAAGLSGVALARGSPFLGIVWLLVSLLADLLDGDLARLREKGQSGFGAFLDSTADRISEALIFGGLLIGRDLHGGGLDWPYMTVWVLALAGSFLVSYTRARAEGLGLECRVGVADRAARMVIFLIMLIVGYRGSGWFLLALALLSWFTVYQRFALVWRATRPRPDAHDSPGGGE